MHIRFRTQVKDPERVMRMENEMMDKLAAIPGVSHPLRLAMERRSRGLTTTTFSMRKTRLMRRDRFRPSGDTGLFRPDISRPLGLHLSRDAISPGPTYTTSGMSRWSPRTWRGRCGVRRQRRWANASAKVPRIHGARLWPWWATSTMTACSRRRRRSAYWPTMMDYFGAEPVTITRVGVFVIRSSRAATQSFLAEARQGIWSVDANLAGIPGADAERCLRRIHGADLIYVGACWGSPASWRWCWVW